MEVPSLVPSLVGYTSSNKVIYQYDLRGSEKVNEIVSGFTQADHFDSAAVFSYLQLVYWRKYGEDSLEFISATDMLYLHNTSLTDEFSESHAKALGIITAFDLAKFGRKHCVSHLQGLLDT